MSDGYHHEGQDVDGAELVDYEIEAPEEIIAADPVPVCVKEPVVTVPTVAHHAVFRTFVLTTDDPCRQILTLDPLRLDATVISLDQDVVITSSKAQAQSAGNLVAGLAAADGAVLPKNVPLPVQAVGEMWVTAPTGYPARVSVTITRRTP